MVFKLVVASIVTMLALNARADDTPEVAGGKKLSVNIALDENLKEVCLFMLLQKAKGSETCEAPIIDAICSQDAPTLRAAAEFVASGPEVKALVTRNPGGFTTMVESVEHEFTEAANKCLSPSKAQKPMYDESELPPAVPPEIARQRFWRWTMASSAKVVARGITAVATGRSVKWAVLSLMTGGFCQAGLDTAKEIFINRRVNWNKDQCGEKIYTWKAGHLRSCLGTAASLCGAAAGIVDFGRWKYLGTDNQILGFFEDAASLGVEAVCTLQPYASPLCGLINAAVEQILMAASTGNNEWAECSGVSQVARCIGQTWGAGGSLWNDRKGWVSNQPIAQAKVTEDEVVVRDCCFCQQAWYEEHWGFWNNDVLFKRNNWLSAVQDGSFATGNCNYPGGRYQGEKIYPGLANHNGHTAYFTFSECRKVKVVGNRCSLSQCRGSNCKNERVELFDDYTQQPSGRFIY